MNTQSPQQPLDENPNTKLFACAFLFDTEFEKKIASKYGVRVLNKTNAPWEVIFFGPRDSLIRMYNDNWSEGDEAKLHRSDSQGLTIVCEPNSDRLPFD